MARLQILVAGETVYDQDVQDWQRPPKPEFIGAAVEALPNPNIKPPPFLKAMLLAMLGSALKSQLRDSQLAPLDVDLQLRATGWTLSVDQVAPSQQIDVEVIEHKRVVAEAFDRCLEQHGEALKKMEDM